MHACDLQYFVSCQACKLTSLRSKGWACLEVSLKPRCTAEIYVEVELPTVLKYLKKFFCFRTLWQSHLLAAQLCGRGGNCHLQEI